MKSFRISLAASMAIIALIALGLAGMMSASRVWTAVAGTLTLALLLTALLAAGILTGIDRAFWTGFALFGWVYLLLVNWDWIRAQFGHDLTAGLSEVAEVMIPEVRVPVPPPQSPIVVSAPQTGRIVTTPTEEILQRQIKVGNFVQIGRMFLSLLFAMAGGFIARLLAERPGARRNTPGPEGPPLG